MESHGEVGKIQITQSTYELIKDEFECVPRGMIEIKGKGDMETWFLVGRKQTD
jgi:guanylate cyclase